MNLIERFVASAPDVARARVERLVQRAPDYVAELRASVRAHTAEARARASESNAAVDVPLAEAIGSALEALLSLDADHGIPERRIVTAAVAYFVDAEEGGSDFGSCDGLVGDAEVTIATLETLGHADLARPVRDALRGRASTPRTA